MKKYGIKGYEATHNWSIDGKAFSEIGCSYYHHSNIIIVEEGFMTAKAEEKEVSSSNSKELENKHK